MVTIDLDELESICKPRASMMIDCDRMLALVRIARVAMAVDRLYDLTLPAPTREQCSLVQAELAGALAHVKREGE